MTDIKIFSNSFGSDQTIDKKYSFSKGNNISPHVKIENVPVDTKQMILLMYDPDAVKVCGKVFVHWFAILDSTVNELQENESCDALTLLANDIGKKAYCGPAPPKGTGVHHYHLAVYALNDYLTFDEKESYDTIQDKIKSKIISSNEIIGTYESI